MRESAEISVGESVYQDADVFLRKGGMMNEQKEHEAFEEHFEVQGNYSSAWDGWLARAEIAEREIRKLNQENFKYRAEFTTMAEAYDKLDEGMHRIKQWCKAYPIEVFPEPDMAKANEVLKANGITLDAIAAHCMRHITNGIQEIIDETERRLISHAAIKENGNERRK